jgi:2'-5' RNA ligase
MRAFVAVPLGEDVVRAAAALSAALRRRLGDLGASAKWVPPQNMHVTLRFLGNISEAQVPAIRETLGPVVLRHAAFLAGLRGIGAFPDPRRPSVLWIGVSEGGDAFQALAADVGRALDGLGFPEEDRPFHAHLTLARLRRGAPPCDLGAVLEEQAAADAGQTVVREVVLFESSLRPRGPVYCPVWRGTLNPGGRPGSRPPEAEPGPGPRPAGG